MDGKFIFQKIASLPRDQKEYLFENFQKIAEIITGNEKEEKNTKENPIDFNWYKGK